jgi:hypothetical protein
MVSEILVIAGLAIKGGVENDSFLQLLWSHLLSPLIFTFAMSRGPTTWKAFFGTCLLALTTGRLAGAADCPDYAQFSSKPQGNNSAGPLALPFMRPSEECRTFTSPAVEVSRAPAMHPVSEPNHLQKVITDMKSRMKDPDLARLFENTFPSTLDTTVKYFSADQNLAFIITGVRALLILVSLEMRS